jgi:archaellum component FlaC
MNNVEVSQTTVAGALYDFVAWLTTRDTTVVVGKNFPVYAISEAIQEWAAKRGLSLDNANVENWEERLAKVMDSDNFNYLFEVYQKAKALFDNRLGWENGYNAHALMKFWTDLGVALFGQYDYRVEQTLEAVDSRDKELEALRARVTDLENQLGWVKDYLSIMLSEVAPEVEQMDTALGLATQVDNAYVNVAMGNIALKNEVKDLEKYLNTCLDVAAKRIVDVKRERDQAKDAVKVLSILVDHLPKF